MKPDTSETFMSHIIESQSVSWSPEISGISEYFFFSVENKVFNNKRLFRTQAKMSSTHFSFAHYRKSETLGASHNSYRKCFDLHCFWN